MVIPPEIVPALLNTLLLAICRLCAQACTKIPPPPWEASVMPKPSMLDGLHWKFVGYWLAPPGTPPVQIKLLSPVEKLFPVGRTPGAFISSWLPAGKSASAPDPNMSADPAGILTPFARTVIAAPS